MPNFKDWLLENWRYRELIFFMVWRDIKVRYKQTLLGAAWAVIQPLFTMIVFTLFFGNLGRIPSDGIPYPIFSYSALVAWTYFSTALSYSGNSLVGNSNLLTKVYFPRASLPASAVLSGVPDFLLASLILVGLMGYYHIAPSWAILLWPVLLIPLIFLALGVGLFLSALNVKFRDIKYALPFIVQLMMFLSPVIYPASMVPERYRVLAALNPLTGILEAFRSSLFPARTVDWKLLGISLLVTAIIFVSGLLFFRKAESDFADVI
ncbi:MAG TPA: ABC transporter permease [Fibrobacteria bacterium]|nr:ABC transporter permease [Fibrobacteria bacterium]